MFEDYYVEIIPADLPDFAYFFHLNYYFMVVILKGSNNIFKYCGFVW